MGLIESLGEGPVALDSAVFIYFIEDHPDYRPALLPIFTAIEAGRLRAVTSAVTLLEVLVVPYRAKNFDLATDYEMRRGLHCPGHQRPSLAQCHR